MKYSSRIYAKVLAELMAEKKSDKKIADNFLKLLEKNGDAKKIKEIISLAEKIYFNKAGKRKIILETARKTNNKELISKIAKEKDVVQEKINPNLVAGVKIIINNEKQLDFSLKRKLEQTFNNV